MLANRDVSRFDVLHQHLPFSGLLAALGHDVPVVLTLHRPSTTEMRVLYEQVADRGSFVAVSEAQRATIPGLRYAGVVYNGIDLELFPLREEKEEFLMACGTPVIATPRGPVPEVVEDGVTGFIVPVQGYAEAAAGMVRRVVAGYERVYETVVAA